MFGTEFNAIDIAALVIVFVELLLGLRRGLSGEVPRLISTLITVGCSFKFYLPLGDLIASNTRLGQNPDQAIALAFLVLLLGVGLLMLGIRLLVSLVMKVTFNEKIDRGGGAGVGLLVGVLLVVLLVYAAGLWPHAYVREQVVKNSLTGRTLFTYAPRVLAGVGIHAPLQPDVKPVADMPEKESSDVRKFGKREHAKPAHEPESDKR